jgi:hypothetical protein
MTSPTDIYPGSRHTVIYVCSRILDKDPKTISYHDVDLAKSIIKKCITTDEYTVQEIKDSFKITERSYFSLSHVIKFLFGKTIKDLKPKKDGYTDYKSRCQFTFDICIETKVKGHTLLSEYVLGTNGLDRDHMFSIYDGFKNNIDPEVIKHPANCELLLSSDNRSKGSNSSITIDELMNRIELWDDGEYILEKSNNSIARANRNRSDEYKTNLSNKLFGKKNYTDGKINIWVYKDEPPPAGFVKGVTKTNRKKYDSQNHKGKQYYTNGTINKVVYKGAIPPEGFWKGKS